MKRMNSFFQKPRKGHVQTRLDEASKAPSPATGTAKSIFAWHSEGGPTQSDRNTNIDTDHLALIIEVKQKSTAIRRESTGITLKGARAETDKQEEYYNSMVVQGIIRRS